MPRQQPATKSRARKVSLLPKGPYARFHEAYGRMMMALAGAAKGPSDLGRCQERAYWCLREPFHEYAISHLHDWWDYDQARLLNRRGRADRAKPRIVLNAFITKPGNLSLEWTPDTIAGSDWTSFHRLSGYGPYRPSNELMFIREVRKLNPNPKPEDFYGPLHDRLVDAHLLACVGAALNEIERRLAISFELRWTSKFVLVWEPDKKGAWTPRPDGHPLLGWQIEDVAAQVRRKEASELATLLEITQRDAAGFVSLLIEIEPGLTLENLRSDAAHVRLQKKLRQHGIAITPAPLARLVKLLEDQHAELLRPLWRSVGSALQVVK
jgi:hypothetical protein